MGCCLFTREPPVLALTEMNVAPLQHSPDTSEAVREWLAYRGSRSTLCQRIWGLLQRRRQEVPNVDLVFVERTRSYVSVYSEF